jgi:aldehyde dehydrogenase
MINREQMVAEIAREVVAQLQLHLKRDKAMGAAVSFPTAYAAAGDGVFVTVNDAVAAAAAAQPKVAAMSLEDRGRMISIIRSICSEQAEELGRMEMEETKIGRLEHKIGKLRAMKHVVGVEQMERIQARSDASGLCVIERAPWGVIGMVLPATHSVPTMVSNAINILAAGNAAVFNPHPAGAQVAAHALKLFNREIERTLGVSNVITTIARPTIETAEGIFSHPDVALLCVTGGPAVVKAAMKAGKRVIAAGPGNPPVVVDETADLNAAARAIIFGGAFDNNLLCIGEKEIFVVASVADEFKRAMTSAGAYELNKAAIDRLTKAAFTFEGDGKGCAQAHVKKDFVGQDAAVIAQAAGVRVPASVVLLFGETDEHHPFVQEEQMMPFVPMVRVPDIDAAIAASVRAERGYRHTAVIHSQKLENVTKMARAMNTTLFIHNAPSTGSLGVDGPGYFSHTIATPTGEGITTPLTFTRERQIAIGSGALRII